MNSPRRFARASRLLAALGVVLALGVISRLYPLGYFLYDKSLGDALYAVAAYLVLALLLSRFRPLVVAPLAWTVCLAVECFKLTGLPSQFAHFAVVRWLLGASFSWHNLACYAVGAALIAAIDGFLLRRLSPHQGTMPARAD